MRILFAVSHLSVGGAERVVSILSSEFVKRGHEVGVVAVQGDERFYETKASVSYFPIVVTHTKILAWPMRVKKLRRIFLQYQPDLIISFLDGVSTKSLLANHFPKRKIILSERNDPNRNEMSRTPLKQLRNFLFAKADAVVFQTKDAMQYFPEPIRAKGRIIYNPITTMLPTSDRELLRKCVVGIGRLEAQKNWPLLLNAFEKFVDEFPEYTLELYGKGTLEQALRERVESSDLIREKVIFRGFVKDVHKQIADSAMFVLPSDFEGLSNAMIEAMALGIPTICTDCPIGGAKEIIDDGENGLLVPVGDEEALLAAMRKIASDTALAQKLSANALKIKEMLNVEKIVKQWNVLINEVASM